VPVPRENVDATTDERTLALRAGEGDSEAFSRLVDLFQERSIRIAYSFLGNAEDARDATQEAFVKAWQALPSFRGGSRFSTWLYRILANHCKDRLRQRKARELLFFWKTPDEGPADPPEAVFRGRGPAEATMDGELEARIRKAAGELPFRQRCVFSLRYLEGFALDEIAETLGISLGAVKANLWQACRKMKSSLADCIGEEA